MANLSVSNLLGIKHLKKSDINLIFKTADHFKEVINRPIKKVPSLRDITIANLFFENSTRTRLSFELAEKRLSADIINFSAVSSFEDGGLPASSTDFSSSRDFTWNGSYTLTYEYVPIPSAVWLFGSGLIGLIGVSRRKT